MAGGIQRRSPHTGAGNRIAPPEAGAGATSLPDLRWAFFGGDVLTLRNAARLRALSPAPAMRQLLWRHRNAAGRPWRGAPCRRAAIRGWPCRSGAASTSPSSWCAIRPAGSPASARWGRSASAARTWRSATWTTPGLPRSASSPTPSPRRLLPATASTARATSAVTCRTAASRSPGGPTAKSRCAVTASRPPRWRRSSRHPRVREAVVLGREDDRGERSLAAWVVPAEGAPALPAELRAFLRERLPDYMVPQAFSFLAALPLTPTASSTAAHCRSRARRGGRECRRLLHP